MPAIDIRAQDAGHNLPRGITLIVTAFLCSALMGASSKSLHQVPPLLTLFFQYAIGFLCFLPSGMRLGMEHLRTRHLGLQIFRSVVGSACQLLFFMSLESLPLLDSSLLSNAAPLFIPLVIWIWFRKSIRWRVAFSLLIGLAGVLLVIHPGPQMLHNPASLLALGSGILSAIALVATNRLAETDPPARTLLYNFGASAVLLIPVAVQAWRPLSGRAWLTLVSVGVLFALTQWFLILAYRYASAAELSPFNYSVVVFSGLLGWILYGNVPTAEAVLGTAFICGGGILSIYQGHPEGRGSWFGFGHWRWLWKVARHPADAA
ncbi:MAG TPA: DMT family transporter [Terracidiphilus sp.]|jgi:drug/metabolite transporter (DMT)-like permease